MKNRIKGSITVFYSLVFVSLLILFGTLYEGIKAYATKKMVMEYEYLTLDNILACYVKELWEDYHLFFADTRSEKEEIRSTLPGGFYDTVIEEEPVEEYGFYKEKGVLEEQITEFMKYAAIGDLADLLEAGASAADQYSRMESSAEQKLQMETACAEADRIRSDGFEMTDEMKKDHEAFLSDIAVCEGDEADVKDRIYRHMGLLEDETRGIQKKLSGYGSAYGIASEKMSNYSQSREVDTDFERLQEYMTNSSNEVDRTEEILSSNGTKISEIKEMCTNEEISAGEVLGKLRELDYSEAGGEYSKGQGGDTAEYTKKLKELMSEGILKLVLPEGYICSGNRLDSSRADRDNEYDGENGNRILTAIYANSHFGKYGEPQEKGTVLAYELEYIVSGNEGDRDNLAGVAERLLAIRTGANFLKLLSDADKLAQAEEIALALVGATGCAPAVFAVKTSVLLFWATQDAVDELRKLYAGERIDDLTYEQYVLLLIAAENNNKVLSRMSDLIENNMRLRYNGNFALDDLYSKVSKNVSVTVKTVFTDELNFSTYYTAGY